MTERQETSMWHRCMLEGDRLAARAAVLLGRSFRTMEGARHLFAQLVEQNQIFLDPPHDQHVTGGPNAGWTRHLQWSATVSGRCRRRPNPHDATLPDVVGRGIGDDPVTATLRAIVSSFGDDA